MSWRMTFTSKPALLASEKMSLMSPASALRSSSSRSTRSMIERSRSTAYPPTSVTSESPSHCRLAAAYRTSLRPMFPLADP